MQKSTFHIPKMDCPSEESMIRMKLEELEQIRNLEFDIPNRQLAVFHEGDITPIEAALASLHLGSEHKYRMEIDDKDVPSSNDIQSKALIAVLIINFSFFLVEVVAGILAGSMGLVADSLDMLADAFVYGLSLMAVGGTVARKKSVAKWAGYFQMALAILGFVEVLRRFIGVETQPHFQTMILVSFLALIANSVCLWILQRSRSKEAHMRASMIFTSNDIIINLGVIFAGILVFLLDTGIPDLVIGGIVFLIVVRGAFRILNLSK